MTFNEFKAWFDGFTEAMDGPPTVAQWERIQKRMNEVQPALEPSLRPWGQPWSPGWLVGAPYNGTPAISCGDAVTFAAQGRAEAREGWDD